MNKKMGKSGNGTKIHIVTTGVNVSGIEFAIITCGAEQFNGSNNGRLSRLMDLDLTKVTCKRCLKNNAKV